MNKRGILDFLLIKYDKNDKVSKEILNELKDAINEMEAAECLFNMTSDPGLIEAAIYKEEAAKRKFDYLIRIAKEEYNQTMEI